MLNINVPERSEIIKKDLENIYKPDGNTNPIKKYLSTKGFNLTRHSLVFILPINHPDLPGLHKEFEDRFVGMINAMSPELDTIRTTWTTSTLIAHNTLGLIGVVNIWPGTSTIDLAFLGQEDLIEAIKDIDTSVFDDLFEKTLTVSVIDYGPDGRIRAYSRRSEYYPETEHLSALYPQFDTRRVTDDFISCQSGVFFMIGDPGTGKSTYIRYLLSRAMDADDNGLINKITLLDNNNLITDTGLIPRIREMGSGEILVIEDADDLIAKRVEGNLNMSSLLGMISGVAQENIRIIITTNQTSLKHVDEALLRPGRTRHILNFKPYTANQASKVIDVLGITHNALDPYDPVTLAELTNTTDSANTNPSKIGF